MVPRLLAVGILSTWLVASMLAPSSAIAEEAQIVNTSPDGIAIRGYDTVAYFTEGKAMKGDPANQHAWQGGVWLFATPEHREMFASDPERYAPRFGGFCTGGLSMNVIQQPNPENWLIIDGNLYLNTSKEGLERLKDEAVIATAAENWTSLSTVFDRDEWRACPTCEAD